MNPIRKQYQLFIQDSPVRPSYRQWLITRIEFAQVFGREDVGPYLKELKSLK